MGDRGNAAGNTAHQMFFNAQFLASGGAGWMRLVEFLADGQTVRVRTFSPYLDLVRTAGADMFEFTITPVLPGDFNGDHVVDGADYTIWRDAVGGNDLSADVTGDGIVDVLDWHIWRTNFGRSLPGTAATIVPEPQGLAWPTGACVLIAGGWLAERRARRRA